MRTALLVLALLVAVGAAASDARTAADFEPAAVSFVSASRGWALGRIDCRDCAGLRITEDGGRSWAVLPSPRVRLSEWVGARGAVGDIRFADAANGFLFGPGLLSTHDGGRSWRRQPLPPVQALDVGARYAYVLTRATATARDVLWRAVVGSDRWTRLPLPAASGTPSVPNAHAYLTLAVSGAAVVLLQLGFEGLTNPSVTRAMLGQLWFSSDFGNAWRTRVVPCTPPDGGAAALAIARGHPNAWLVDCFDNEQSQQAQQTQHHVYGTADAGATWVRLADPTRRNEPDLLADNGAGHAFLATEGGAGDTLVGTLDGGRHWHQLLASGGSFYGWADLRFVTTSVGFVVGPTHYAPEHIYRTDDGGRTWRPLSIR